MTPKSEGKFEKFENLPFDWSLSCKEYNVWPKKNTEELSFTTPKSHEKFEGRLACGLENDMKNFAIFHESA